MRKIAWASVALLLAASGLAWWQRDVVALLVAPRVAERVLERNALSGLPDGLHLALCGAGSPLPDPRRSGPCVAVIAGKHLFVVDAGTGAARTLRRLAIPPGSIEALFLTHFHSDHIDGLGELAMQRWVQAAHTAPLPVYGPPGVEEVAQGFNQAYRLDSLYRSAHHGPGVAPISGAGLHAMPYAAPTAGAPVRVYDADGVQVSAFAVEHQPAEPAVGLRFDYAGRSLVISGDTAKSAEVLAQARGAELLVHEALDERQVAVLHDAAVAAGDPIFARITADIPGYHTTPRQAAEIAAAAGVKALLYYHIVPALVLPGSEKLFLRGTAAIYDGPIVLGHDGVLVSLPRGGDVVQFSELP